MSTSPNLLEHNILAIEPTVAQLRRSPDNPDEHAALGAGIFLGGPHDLVPREARASTSPAFARAAHHDPPATGSPAFLAGLPTSTAPAGRRRTGLVAGAFSRSIFTVAGGHQRQVAAPLHDPEEPRRVEPRVRPEL